MRASAPRKIAACFFMLTSVTANAQNALTILDLGDATKSKATCPENHPALILNLDPENTTGIPFMPPEGGQWDFSPYAALRLTLYNPNKQNAHLELRLEMPPTQDSQKTKTRSLNANIPPNAHSTMTLFFTDDIASQYQQFFWGMRGLPIRNMEQSGDELDLKNIATWRVLQTPQNSTNKIYLESAHLLNAQGFYPEALVPLPFIDRFGQFKHEKWNGKTTSESDLRRDRDQEAISLSQAPALPGRDAFGGWAQGPKLKASGWFRSEKVGKNWWLVTPAGHLFFSNGIDCVGLSDDTFVEGRSPWFEWLPTPELPPFGNFYTHAEKTHSMAEKIGGKGKTLNFYKANLFRKYDQNWENAWQQRSYDRMRAWGFNTLGNWCDWKILKKSPLPFVASAPIEGVPEIAGANGYWGKMKDVYAPEFHIATEKAVKSLLNEFGDNPLCIGYFLDNELAWEGVSQGVLKSPINQPARIALINLLQHRYKNIDALNSAWETQWKSWDEISEPQKTNDAIQKDQYDYLYQFSLKYFQTIKGAFNTHNNRQLYLGCRFASAPDAAVKASTEVADISSFNLYHKTINCNTWQTKHPWDAPMLIGEFHFGAKDRGMFHPGLVPAENQKNRAEHYINYVRSVADCPNFVGCHWFQYVDEPTTGRYFDGENYNIGFVNICDTPYTEMVVAAKKTHTEIYTRRFNRP